MEETTALDTYRHELDEISQNVMPESWEGHARIAAYEQAADLSPKGRHLSVKLAEKVATKHDVGAEKAASLAVKKITERL